MDRDLTYILMGKPPAVPVAVTSGDWDDVLDRLANLEAGLAIGDLSDVDLAGLADGHILVYDEDDDEWKVQAPIGGIATVKHQGTGINSADVTVMNFGLGLTTTETAPGQTQTVVAFGGTGSANTVARQDHVHSAPIGKRGTFAATGVLSSGTRSLVSTTFGPLAAGIPYDIEAWFLVRARNNVNSGTFNLLARVGADGGYPQLSRNVQTVGGVPVDQHIDFGDANGDMAITGTGASLAISFSAQYSTGDAVDLRDGFYRVVARPRR